MAPSDPAEDGDAREPRTGRLQVGRLHRFGPTPSRMLLIASSRIASGGRQGVRRFDERLADRIRALGGRGLDLDVLGEPARVLAAIERNPSFWRMWRYDVLAVVLPRRSRPGRVEDVVEAVLAEASERSRVVLVDGVGDDGTTDGGPAHLQADLGRRQGLEALAEAMTEAAGPVEPAADPDLPRGLRHGVPDEATLRRLQEVVHIARQAFGTETALITLTADTDLLVVAAEGADLGPLPRESALCDRTVRSRDPNVLLDTWQDPEARRLETTQGPDGIRFYAGLALCDPDGQAIGTLCVFDPEPRPEEPHDWTLLKDLAMLAEAELAASA